MEGCCCCLASILCPSIWEDRTLLLPCEYWILRFTNIGVPGCWLTGVVSRLFRLRTELFRTCTCGITGAGTEDRYLMRNWGPMVAESSSTICGWPEWIEELRDCILDDCYLSLSVSCFFLWLSLTEFCSLIELLTLLWRWKEYKNYGFTSCKEFSWWFWEFVWTYSVFLRGFRCNSKW